MRPREDDGGDTLRTPSLDAGSRRLDRLERAMRDLEDRSTSVLAALSAHIAEERWVIRVAVLLLMLQFWGVPQVLQSFIAATKDPEALKTLGAGVTMVIYFLVEGRMRRNGTDRNKDNGRNEDDSR